MKTEHAIHIAAPQSLVWSVTIDVENWPPWTPTVESVKRQQDGPFEIGSTALVKQPGLPEAEWVVTAFEPESRFTWESRLRGMRVIATHELSPVDAGTQSVLRIEMPGLLPALLWPLVRPSVRRSLEQENAGLKAECEAHAP